MATIPPTTRRRGQVIVLAPVMLAVLGAVLALTTDVGHMLVAQARLQNVADAAAMAAAQVLIESRNAGLSEQQARAAAESEALAIQQANWDEAGLALEFGYRAGQSFAAAGLETPATAVRARAFRNDDAPGGRLGLFFAGIMGLRHLELNAPATCQIAANIRGYRGNLSPFAVPEDKMVPPGQEMVFYPAGEEDGSGSGGSQYGLGHERTAPGNWGLLNFDGGSNNTPELQDWILNGYLGGLEADPDTGYIWVEGCPGWRAALQDAVSQRIGDSLVMLIYDQVTGQGSNCNYRIVGFFRATILQVQMTGNNKRLTCRVDRISTVHDVLLGGSVQSVNLRKVQLFQ